MRLTDKYIASLKYEGKQTKIFDDSLPNFGVRLYQPGPSFIVMLGKERRLKTIGRYPKVSLKEARTKALSLLNDVNPAPGTETAQEVISIYLTHCEQRNRPRTVKDYTRLLNSYFPKGKLSEITKDTLIRKLQSLSHKPGEQFHVSAVFQTFLNWSVHNSYLVTNPLAGLRKQGSLNKRDRVLADNELKAVWECLGNEPFSAVVKLMILTGQRRSEALHISIDDGMAVIPKEYTKNGIEHVFPVGGFTLKHFRSVTFNGWSKSKARLDKQCGITEWTLHDLRRTYATNHARLGTPIHVVEKLLNHISGSFGGIVGVYQKYQYQDEMREAVQRYEMWLQFDLLGDCNLGI